jgi:hypothetical protein
VRPGSWDESPASGPAFSYGAGQAPLRSVVVERDETSVMRSAQIPQPTGAGTGADPGIGQTPTERDTFLQEMERSFGLPPSGQPGVVRPGSGEPPGAVPPTTPGEFLPTRPGQDSLPTPGLTASPESTETEQQRADQVCSDALADLKAATLDKVVLNINVTGTAGRDYPFECVIAGGEWHAGRCWPETVFTWKASALCHKPLYFEDEQMERYGHSWGPCCDPIVSGVHFFTRLPVLPYCMGVEPPCECVYALGHYRPGSCAPRYIEPVPISWRGALFQAGATVGAAAILP